MGLSISTAILNTVPCKPSFLIELVSRIAPVSVRINWVNVTEILTNIILHKWSLEVGSSRVGLAMQQPFSHGDKMTTITPGIPPVVPVSFPNRKEGEGQKGSSLPFQLSVYPWGKELLSTFLLMPHGHSVNCSPLKIISKWEWSNHAWLALSLAHPQGPREGFSYSELFVAKPSWFILTMEGGTIAVV